MANNLKCENCSYFWKEEGDKYPMCNWVDRCPGDIPPCEEEPYWEWEE